MMPRSLRSHDVEARRFEFVHDRLGEVLEVKEGEEGRGRLPLNMNPFVT
jgi:hypothetical protein